MAGDAHVVGLVGEGGEFGPAFGAFFVDGAGEAFAHEGDDAVAFGAVAEAVGGEGDGGPEFAAHVGREGVEGALLEFGDFGEHGAAVAVHPGFVGLAGPKGSADECAADDDVGAGLGGAAVPDGVAGGGGGGHGFAVGGGVSGGLGFAHGVHFGHVAPGEGVFVGGVGGKEAVKLGDAAGEGGFVAGDPAGEDIFSDPGVDGELFGLVERGGEGQQRQGEGEQATRGGHGVECSAGWR